MAGLNTPLVEVLHHLSPFDDRETLNSRASTKNYMSNLCRLEHQLDGFLTAETTCVP